MTESIWGRGSKVLGNKSLMSYPKGLSQNGHYLLKHSLVAPRESTVLYFHSFEWFQIADQFTNKLALPKPI